MTPERESGPCRDGASAKVLIRGLLAGLAATAAMSLSQQIEMALTGRRPSSTPAEALCLVLGIETRTEAQEQRLVSEAHWAYGSVWGLGHTISSRWFDEPSRTTVYFLAVWAAGAALLSITGLAPPPYQWKPKSLASDLLHHGIYAIAGSAAYRALGWWPQLGLSAHVASS